MTGSEEALSRLAESTAEAIGGVLEMFCPGQVQIGAPSLGGPEMVETARPSVVTHVAYAGGATGGNVFSMTRSAARLVAAAMMGQEPEGGAEPLSERELSAVGEAMKQVMSAAAAATGAVLGQEVVVDAPHTVELAEDDPLPSFEQTPHATSLPIDIGGEACRLVQLVPNAFLVRMTRALEELGAQVRAAGARASGVEATVLANSLADVPVRLWAELGRTTMPAGQVVDLPVGTVVDLDREVSEPVDLYVNGLPFARGRLVVTDGSDWAVEIETVIGGGAE